MYMKYTHTRGFFFRRIDVTHTLLKKYNEPHFSYPFIICGTYCMLLRKRHLKIIWIFFQISENNCQHVFFILNMWYCFRTSLFLIANLYSGDIKDSLSCFIFPEGQRLIIWILEPFQIKENSVWSMSSESTDSLRNKR